MKADLLIIGAGPGGYETAITAAEEGLSVVIVEMAKVVGTCLTEGCIPTKSFCRNAEVMSDFQSASEFGFSDVAYTFDFSKVVARKNQVVATLNAGIEGLLKNKLITRVQGKAQFKDAHTILVPGATDVEGNEVDEVYEADNVIIATGSVTKFLPIAGIDLPGVVTSAELLNIERIPERLCIIGGGVIGLEFASIFNTFGSKVTVIEYCKEILPNFDSDIATRLKQTLKGKGITFENQSAVTTISEAGAGLSVQYEQKGKVCTSEADVVLMSVGRVPNVASVNLSDIGVACERNSIVVDERMQTNVPGVYAVGDVNGLCMLAHAATFQGRRALYSILGKEDKIRLDIVPGAVFTSPEAAMVGLTEEQCKAAGIKCICKKAFFRANGKALSMGEPDGMVKLIADESGKLLGCHMFGAHSADLIQEVTVLLSCSATVDGFKDVIHGHPTLGEVIQNAVWEF